MPEFPAWQDAISGVSCRESGVTRNAVWRPKQWAQRDQLAETGESAMTNRSGGAGNFEQRPLLALPPRPPVQAINATRVPLLAASIPTPPPVPPLPPLPPLPPSLSPAAVKAPPPIPAVTVPAITAVKVLAAWTGGKWEELSLADVPDTDDPEEKARQIVRRKTSQAIGNVMTADQLVSLFGLGPSAGVGGPTMGDLWRFVKAKDSALFKRIQAKTGDKTPDAKAGNIEELLSHCQMIAHAPIGADKEAETFISEAEKIIAGACRKFLDTADLSSHEHLLRVLARRPSEKPRARVFTTNYDLCIEQAAASAGLYVVDGFGREMPPVFDGANYDVDFVRRRIESKSPDYLDGVMHLIKLHGSVDWERSENSVIRREMPSSPVIIYPRSDKFELSYRQPFLETISQLQTSLRQPNLGLLVVGFSFSDAHLSEMLLAAVRRNLSLRIVVATLNCENHCNELDFSYRPALHSLMKLASQGDSRITLVDCDFPSLARLAPNAGTETEEDRLRSVIRGLLK